MSLRSSTANAKEPNPSIWSALIPIVFLILALSFNVLKVFGDDAISGSNQMILLFSGAVAAIVGFFHKVSWLHMLEGIVKSISSTVPAIIILLLIGGLAGTWMLSGVVPAMIYYGLQILHPSYFLIASCVICALVSVATGSSWSTIATVGIALLGIGKALGVHDAMIAGAIISGAYFGDKISPLSDTTNLAPAMAGTDLFTHIRYLMLTTTPSFIIALLIFGVIGLMWDSPKEVTDIGTFSDQIKSVYFIHPVLFLVPAAVILMIVKKVPAIPALFIGMLGGALFAILFQQRLIVDLQYPHSSFAINAYHAIMDAMTVKLSIIVEQNEQLSDLLTSKGMHGMLDTIWLVISAMIFGGIMESCGFLGTLANRIKQYAKNTFSLISTTSFTCISVNVLASDQYLSIVIPGKMYEKLYRNLGLKPENLSRTLEDAGTVTSPLVPWNTCGAYHAGVLGVATGAYLPYCFFNLISPIMTLAFALFNIKIRHYTKEEMDQISQSPTAIS